MMKPRAVSARPKTPHRYSFASSVWINLASPNDYKLIQNCLYFKYCSRFWQAPYHGACLHQMIANPNLLARANQSTDMQLGRKSLMNGAGFGRAAKIEA